MKIVKIKGRDGASFILTGEELLGILPPDVLDELPDDFDDRVEELGVGARHKLILGCPFEEIEDTKEAIEKAMYGR